MNGRTQQILLHIAGCLLFLTLPILFSPESLDPAAYLTNPPTQRELLYFLLILAVFYLNYFQLIPRLYYQRRYLAYFLINLACFLLISFLPGQIIHPDAPGNADMAMPQPDMPPAHQSGMPPRHEAPMHQPGMSPSPDFHDFPPLPHHRALPGYISQHLFLFLVVIFFALMLKIRERWKQAEKQRLHAELSYLKAQINPHFLFNSLNSIYALTLERSDLAPTAVVQLSAIMRYVLSEAGKETVPLDKELSCINNYIDLQLLRFGKDLSFDYQIRGEPGDLRIAPLLLLPFIENAFKHGINPEEDARIQILIALTGHELQMTVTNNKVSSQFGRETHNGLGITNTRARLQNAYPGRHSLIISDNPTDFKVFLSLKLQ